jgi:hypothetical protein
VPPQVETEPAGAAVDWRKLFDAAGLDFKTFTPAEPQWTPRGYSDARAAWVGPLPGIPGEQLRIEAAAYRGRPINFQQIAPWTKPGRAADAAGRSATLLSAAITIAVFSIFVAAAFVARHNLRKGRGDRRGAFQLAAFVSVVAFAVWLIQGRHFADLNLEMQRFFSGQPLWAAGILWLLYVAVEPYVRRFWPRTVVSWSRLMARQWRDPLVGRDILLGIGLGLLIHTLDLSHGVLLMKLGYSLPPRTPDDLSPLLGTHIMIARVLNGIFNAILNALFAVFGMVLLKILVQRERIAAAVAIALMTFTSSQGAFEVGPPVLNLALNLVLITIIVLTIQRLGLLATMFLFLVNFTISGAILTLDSTKWFFVDSVLLLLIPVSLALFGFYASRGGEPIFGRRILD